jgi:ATP-binding cassette subfamily F protein uup
LARLFLRSNNLLVLDEPTNDLDIETLELLEDLLASYQGTLILVSHDRQFVDNTVTSSWIFEGNGVIEEFVGGYHDAQLQRSQAHKTRQGTSSFAKKTEIPANKPKRVEEKAAKKLSYKLQRELEELPAKLEKLEEEINSLQEQVNSGNFFSQPVNMTQPIIDKLTMTEQELEKAFERWEELESTQNESE